MIKNIDYRLKQIEELMIIPKNGGNYNQPLTAIQWKFTPEVIIRKWLNRFLRLKSKTICVILNVEIVLYLIKINYDMNKIYFVSDCEERTIIAKKFGIRDENIFKIYKIGNKCFIKQGTDMIFNEGIMNPDFGNTPELRRVAEKICKRLTLISDTNHFAQRLDNFNNVEQFENLGRGAFKDAEVTTCISRINPKKDDNKIKIIGGNKSITYEGIPYFVPGNDLDEFIWADSIVKKGLPGFDANCGALYTQDVIPPKTDSIPLIFTVGKQNEKEFGRMLECDISQKRDATGYGGYKVAMSKSTAIGKIGALKFAGPEYGCGHNCVSIICKSRKETIDTITYLQSDKVKRLVKVLKGSGVINTKGIFRKIPNLSQSGLWN